jgi:citrate lyase subunit beta / citryl-CoA lyase
VRIPITLLYVPADQPNTVAKALASAADVVIIDLEDAVTPERKELARDGLPQMVEGAGDRQMQVRVNAANTPWSDPDLAIVATLPTAVGARLPKMVDPDQVRRIADSVGGRRLHLLVESALGVERAFALATAHPLVASISLGEADLRSNLGLTSDRGLLWARSRIVNAARAAGLPAPTMSVYANVSDLVGLASSCAEGRELGFLGRTAIHPRKLETITASFRPTDAEVTAARAVLAAVASATESGRGALAMEDGSFLDVAMVEGARKTLALAERS